MNKNTHEFIQIVNSLIEFYNNVPYMLDVFNDAHDDIDLVKEYVEYEIKKTLKDLVHLERL